MTTRTVVNCCARATSKELSRFLWLGTTVIKGCSTGIAAEIIQMNGFSFTSVFYRFGFFSYKETTAWTYLATRCSSHVFSLSFKQKIATPTFWQVEKCKIGL